MIRSAEMMRSKGAPKMPAKVMSHMTVHPQMGGGVRVEHHFTSHHHEPAVKTFGKEQGEAFADHMMAKTGMSWHDGAGDGNEINKEGENA